MSRSSTRRIKVLAISSVVDNRARFKHRSQRMAIEGGNRPHQLETSFLGNVHERREQREEPIMRITRRSTTQSFQIR